MIITVTLNSALDKIFFIDKLVRNKNVRASGVMYDIGGKATHVSMVLSKMGVDNISTGILAGNNGKKLQAMLEEKGVRCDYVWQEGCETREIVLFQEKDSGSYMVSPAGFDITKETIDNLKTKLRKLIGHGDMVVFSGVAPANVTTDIYRELLDVVHEKKGRLVVDTSGPSLREGIRAKPYLIKPNEHEFVDIVGYTPVSDEQYIEELKKLNDQGIEIAALSLGKKGSIISSKDKVLRLYPPKIKEVNDVGCGDVFLGGALAMLSQGKDILESFKFGAAISASKASMKGTSDFSIEQAKELIKGVVVYEI